MVSSSQCADEDVELRADHDVIRERMGFRVVEVRGTEILRNGKAISPRGVCIHAETPYRIGRAWSEKDAKTQLS